MTTAYSGNFRVIGKPGLGPDCDKSPRYVSSAAGCPGGRIGNGKRRRLQSLRTDSRDDNSGSKADLMGLNGSIANGFRVEVCGIPGPRMRGTGGTLICGLGISRDRGHPPNHSKNFSNGGRTSSMTKRASASMAPEISKPFIGPSERVTNATMLLASLIIPLPVLTV